MWKTKAFIKFWNFEIGKFLNLSDRYFTTAWLIILLPGQAILKKFQNFPISKFQNSFKNPYQA
jgi:hypothetical protein